MVIYTSRYGKIPELPTGNALVNFYESPFIKLALHEDAAVIDGTSEKSLTNGESKDAGMMFALHLQQEYDIQKGDVVVIFSLNTIYMMPIHFGALALGATISPANIVYQASELAHQLATVRPKLIICSTVKVQDVADAQVIVKQNARVELLENMEQDINQLLTTGAPKLKIPVPVNGKEHPAYYCFSSGTSGVPKCVITTHQNMISQVHQQVVARPRNLTDIKITAAVLPMSHIYGLTTFIWVLPYLAKPIVVYPKFDFEKLLQGIVKYNIDNLNIVPPIVLLFAKSPLIHKYPEVRSILKSVKSGAAPISKETIALLSKRFGDSIEVVNGYGMTEMSPGSHTKGHDDTKWYEPGSVGWLCPSTEMRLVDPETLQDVTRGSSGEIWIRGPQVMKGYLNAPAATADMLTKDGWLRTGDEGNIDKYEQVYIVGRLKELIKSKGHQVAPAELEGLLLQHTHVLDCAIIGIPDEEGVTELPRAFVKMRQGGDLLSIGSWFNQRVARHKRLWGGLVELDTIPKNNSGKILRRILTLRKGDVAQYPRKAML